MARVQERLMIMEATFPACFLARLAAFFSFGVSTAGFFASLLDRRGLGTVFIPYHVEKTPEERQEAELKDICAGVSLCPAL